MGAHAARGEHDTGDGTEEWTGGRKVSVELQVAVEGVCRKMGKGLENVSGDDAVP